MNYRYNNLGAIIDLIGKVYAEDFVLFGNNLLWVQRKYLLPKMIVINKPKGVIFYQ